MFRALSTRRNGSNHEGYDRIVDDSTTSLLDAAKFNRSRTTKISPGRIFNLSKSPAHEFGSPAEITKFSRSKTTYTKNYSPSPVVVVVSDLSKSPIPESNNEFKAVVKEAKKVRKVHPLFSLFEKSRRKKPTAKPEFSRYIQYLKEGGVWDTNSGKTVIY